MISRTKIIATLGPTSKTETILRKMFVCGLDVVRLNFSHASKDEHIRRIELVRRLNKKMRRAVKIMQDLEGYRIRIGRLAAPVVLKRNAFLYLTQEKIVGNSKVVPFDYYGPLKAVKTDSLVYIDDGKILLKVTGREKKRLKAKVLTSGTLEERKGINIIGSSLSFSALTDKDRKDICVAKDWGLDYVAQSFVRNAQDIRHLKKELGGAKAKIFAKVESREALGNIDEIIDEADGIIIARGDLGVCLPIYKVPTLQKEIIKKCRLKKRPVVVATQMLESMTNENSPTRAEVSDVANAILDGADYLLLSAETAVGRHPDLVVCMMNKIIKNTEEYQDRLERLME